MITKLNIPQKQEGNTLSSAEFNAVVTSINENADSLQETFNTLTNKLNITEIRVNANTVIRIQSVEDLIRYLNEYGTSTDKYNTAPIIKIRKTTYVYKKGEALTFDIELFDSEGGFLTLTGSNPSVTGGYNTFVIENLRSGVNTIDLNQLVYNNTTSKLDVGTYDFTNIYVIDKLGRSSSNPINLRIIIGSIELISTFDSSVSYAKNQAISVRYGISSITNTLNLTYRISGKMLVELEDGSFEYQSYAEKVVNADEFKVTTDDANFVTGDIYYHNFVLPDTFTNIGDYTLTIQAEGLGDGIGVLSNLLNINIVVNEAGILYSSSSFDPNGSYFAGDSIVIPVNIYYNETPETEYTYQCNAWIDGLPITGQSDIVNEQKNIQLKLTLPDDPDLYTIKYKTDIITPTGEIYKTNVNYIALQAKQKSKYAVVTDSASKLELFLTGKGKTNASPNWLSWENRYNLNQGFSGVLTNFSKVVNGWEEQILGNQYTGDCLFLSGDAYASINYSVFSNFDTRGNGLTIDFSLRHGDLIAPNAYNISIGKPNSYPQRGIYVHNNALEIKGLNSNISVPIICDTKVLTKMGEWETGDEYAHICITFDIIKREVFVFINGVISSYGTFSNAANLTHDYPIIVNGYLNEADKVVGQADTKIRFIRVYKTCLTASQVLSNFIASYPNDAERVLLEDLNDEINPILSSAYMQGDRNGIQKDEMRRLFFSFVPGNEELIANTYIPEPLAVGEYGQEYMDMKKEMPVDVDLQGNSSLSYPVKNYGMDIFDAQAWDTTRSIMSKEYSMVLNTDKIPEYRPWANWDSYHLKSNYIDSSHCNNLIMAKLSESIFRLPYNWSDITQIFPQTAPFKNFTVTRPDGVIDTYSRFPVYPTRVAVDGFPFILHGDYTDTNGKTFEHEFIGVYTWNMKQHRKLYSMPKQTEDPNRRYFIYRCESNGDSVHEQLRSGYCKFIDMRKQALYVDSYGRALTLQYIQSRENNEMFAQYEQYQYSWAPINSSEGYLQQHNNKYTWIKYGIVKNDVNLTDSPLSKIYIGIAIDKDSSVKSNNPLDYEWYNIDIYEGIPDQTGTYTLIQYAMSDIGTDMDGSISNKSYIGFVYNAVKRSWVNGVDYFDKTNDPQEMTWRPGAELLMDWECREPDDLGVGHWEELVNGVWTKTYDIIDPKDLDANAINVDKQLRFVWDKIKSTTGDADRSGNTAINYWTSILDDTIQIPTLSDPNQTFAGIDKVKATIATQQHVDFLNAIHWMSNASDECFGNPKIFEKYFDLRTCLDYVLSCLTFCLTDSIGRNLTMIAWDQESIKIEPGVMDRKKMRFYPVFYDIDTAFGTNVQGGLYSTPYINWPYNIGTIYTAPEGAGQEYNCFGTLFLKRISKCYEKALVRRYVELRSGTVDPLDGKTKLSAPFDYLNILQLYTKQMVGRIGERYFNADAVYKYIGYENDADETAKRNYITNARGNKVMFMKNFLRKRMDFIDSLLGYVPDVEDMAYFQHYSKGQLTLTIETMVAGYVRVSFAQNQATSVYSDGINPVTITYNYADVTQHILRIYNCGIITSITGLTNKDVRIARLNSCVNLRVLDLKGNPNFGMEVSTLEISKCKALRTIDLTGCNGANEFTPDISGCVLLEEFLISNSSVGNINFDTNLNLKTIDITECNRFNVLNISNLYRLTTLKFDEHRLVSLNISNSSINVDFSQPGIFNNLQALYIINNSSYNTLQFGENSFAQLKQLSISNCTNLQTVTALFKNRVGYPTLNRDFLGNCPLLTNVESVFENSSLVALPSQMFINSLNIKSLRACFKDCKLLESIPAGIIDSMLQLEDITDIFNGARLQMYVDITELDDFGDTIITGKQLIDVFNSNAIFSNLPKLKYATRAFANSELVNIPTRLFENSPLLQNIDYCFSNIKNINSVWDNQYLKLIINENLFIGHGNIISAIGCFQNTWMTNVNDNMFSNFVKLKYATSLFEGSSITQLPLNIFLNSTLLQTVERAFAVETVNQIPSGFLTSCPALKTITNMFLGSGITALPNGFLKTTSITKFKFADFGIPNIAIVNFDILQNTSVTDISNLYSGTQIRISPNNLFSTNATISIISGIIDNSVIQQIGTNFLYENSVVDCSNLFMNSTNDLIIGENFMRTCTQLLYADAMFEGSVITNTPLNMLNVCPKLISAMQMFYNCLQLTDIKSGLLENAPNLQLITNIFKNTLINKINDRILVNPNIIEFQFLDILTHDISISLDFLRDSQLQNIDNLFSNTNISCIPDGFFSTHVIDNPNQIFYNSKISVIGNNVFEHISMSNTSLLFLNSIVVTIGNNFMSNSGVTILDNMFSNTNLITTIGNNFLGTKENITSAVSMFENSSIKTIGTGFLNNSPELVNIQNIFAYCNLLTELPTEFLNNSPLVNSLNGVFTGNGITSVPDNFCVGNTAITSIETVFTGSNITTIGDYFMSQSTGLISCDNMFLNNTKIQNVGKEFLGNSNVTHAVSIFKGSSIKTIGDDIFKSCLITDISSMFEGSTITTIGLRFFDSCPTLVNIQNIFKSTTLITLPEGFISLSPLVNSLVGVFTGNNITSIPDNFCATNTGITSLAGVFTLSNVSHIGNYFMSNSTGLNNVTSVFENNTKIRNIGSHFFNNSNISNVGSLFKNSSILSIGNNAFNSCDIIDASSLFENSTITTIGTGFFDSCPTLINIQNIFKACANIIELPVGFISASPLVNSLIGVFTGNGITTIPDNFCVGNTGLINLDNVFVNKTTWESVSNVENIGSYFCASTTGLINVSDTWHNYKKLKTIGSNLFANSSITIAERIFQDTTLLLLGENAFSMCALISTNSMFKNSGNTVFTGSFLNNVPTLVDIRYIFNNSEISSIPTGFISTSPLVNSLQGVFDSGLISEIPDNFCVNNTGITSLTGVFDYSNIETIGNNFFKSSTGISNIDSIFENNLIINTIGDNFFDSTTITSAQKLFKNSSIIAIGNNIFNNCNIVNVMEMLYGSAIATIGTGFLVNKLSLVNIVSIFKNTLLTVLPVNFLVGCVNVNSLSGVFDNNLITTIPSYFCQNNTGISSLLGVFDNSNVETIGYNFFDTTQLATIDNIFLNNTKIKHIGDYFCYNSKITSANNTFKGSSVNDIGVSFCVSCPLTDASSMLEGSAIKTINAGFLINFPNLINVQNIFKTTTLNVLPTDFLKYCTKVNSLIGVFTGNNITAVPDNFCANNIGITSLTGVFDNSNIENIGDNFMSNSSGLTSINNLFSGNTKIKSIGKLFLSNSMVTSADFAFYNVTSLKSIGSGVLNNCSMLSLISMFEGCTALKKIGEYTEWYDPTQHATYLYTKEVDVTKCNVAGQQAEVALFCSVPYLESEYDSFTGLTNLANMANIFKGTGLIRTPKGFLKNVSDQTTPASLSSLLVGSQIKFFNPDLYSLSVMTNINTLFDNTNIIAIPTGFMSNYTAGTEVQIQWSGKKTIQFVAYIPKTFLRNCTLATPTLSQHDAYFQTTNVRMLQNDWLNWENPTKYWVDGGGKQIGPSWNYSELVNIPRGYLKCGIKSLRFDRETTLYADKMDTIIPEFAFSTYNGTGVFYSDSYFSSFYAGSIKGVVPKTFLDYNLQFGPEGFGGLFKSQNIIGVENGCMTKPITTSYSQILLNGFFNGCNKLKYIPLTLWSGYDTSKNINFQYTFRDCVLLTKFPDVLKTISKVQNIVGIFSGCTGITNTSGDMDVMIVNLTNQSLLTDAGEMFRGCTSLTRLPDNTLSNSQALTNCTGIFYGCTQLQNIPINLLSYGTTSICTLSNLFYNCSSLQSIPNDFLRYAKGSNCAHVFNGCSNLTGVIPSNFLLGSNGIVTHLYHIFNNCSKITGFENNVWNFNDFSQVVEMQYMFNGSGITTIPSSFCNNNTFLKVIRCEQIFGISKITTVPNNFMNNCPLLTRVDGSFNSVSTLLSIGTGVYENCPKMTNVNNIFQNSVNLTGVIPVSLLRNSVLIINSNFVFNNTKITGIESGNVYERLTSAQSSLDFRSMFAGCTSFSGVLPSLWTLYPNVTSANKVGTFGVCYNATNWYKVPTSWGGVLQRTLLVQDSITSQPVSGATVLIGTTNYTSDYRGIVSIGNGSAINVTVTKTGYQTVITSYPAITDATVNNINFIKL